MKVRTLIIFWLIECKVFADVCVRYDFDEPNIKKVGEYYRVSIPGAISYGAPDKPVLPIKAARVLLPMGEEIAKIEVKPHGETVIPGSYKVEPGQLQVPILNQKSKIKNQKVMPDSTIYNSGEPWPGKLYARGNTYKLCGYVVAHIYLYPVEYVPSRGELSYYKEMEVRITTVKSAKLKVESEKMLRVLPEVQNRVKKLVDNPDVLNTYFQTTDYGLQIIDYIIITNEELKPFFDGFRQFKIFCRGVKTEIATVESIYTQYGGADKQEKIRNFIIDLYMNNGLKYVLLGGDDEIIPHRGLYDIVNEDYPDYEYEEFDIPADLYYGCLDGTWNTDGDGYWGEPDEADLYAEVIVGRVACDSDFEVANFVNKTISYQTAPIATYCTNGLMVGEDLHWQAWGGEYKEEIRTGSSNWGYTTEGFPSHFNVDTLYDNPSEHWDKEALIPLLNAGVHLVNHLGHANPVYAMKMYNQDVRTRLHNPFYFIIHSQGCYCSAFDNRDTDGSYLPEDCIAEQFTMTPNGAVAFIGNTRYGWGDYYTTDGASQRFDREFFDAIFGQSIYNIGDALQDAKENVAPYVDSIDAIRWCYYNLCLLGDPQLGIWTAVPESLIVTYPDTAFIGANSFTVIARSNGNPVEGAFVCIYMDSTVYAREYTNAVGEATLLISPVNVGSLYINVTSHNYLPYEGHSTVVAAGSPYVAYYKSISDDDHIAPSNGNSDGYINPGETIELPLWVRNFGLVSARKVCGFLETTDPYITIQADSCYFGNILPLDSALAFDNYLFTVTNNCPDSHIINLELTCYDSIGTSWLSYPQLRVYAPLLEYEDYTVNDSAQIMPNGVLDPGETTLLVVGIRNDGSATATNVQAVLHTEDTFVTILDSIATYPPILPDSTRTNLIPYIIKADSSTPEHHIVDFYIYVTASGYEDTIKFILRVSLGGDFLVWDPEPNHSSGGIIYNALLEKGHIGDYTQELAPFRSYLTSYKAIFSCLGIWFCNYVLTNGPDVDSLCSFLDQGGNLYIEGGNFWYSDPPTHLHPYFHIVGEADGTSDLDTIIGKDGTITELMIFKYKGENKSIDRIKPGDGAWTIFSNRPAIYDNAVAFRSGKYNTIGTNFELGKLTDVGAIHELPLLVDSIMNWFLREVSHDIAIWSIDIPEYIEPNVGIAPCVTVRNIGKFTETFNVICTIDSLGAFVYTDTQMVNSLPPDSASQIVFNEWIPGEVVWYNVAIEIALPDDELANNSRQDMTFAFEKSEVDYEPLHLFALSNPSPNPMAKQTIIKYALPIDCEVELKIYNLSGQLMRTLVNKKEKAGYKIISWNGTDNYGRPLPSGAYFYSLECNNDVVAKTRKVIIIK